MPDETPRITDDEVAAVLSLATMLERRGGRYSAAQLRTFVIKVTAQANDAARLRGVVADLETRLERAHYVLGKRVIDQMLADRDARLAAGSGDGREAPTEERALTVKGAHRWDVCPDRANCWAREIHDKYHPLPARSLHREG